MKAAATWRELPGYSRPFATIPDLRNERRSRSSADWHQKRMETKRRRRRFLSSGLYRLKALIEQPEVRAKPLAEQTPKAGWLSPGDQFCRS